MTGDLFPVVQPSRRERTDGGDQLVATQRPSKELDLRSTIGRDASHACGQLVRNGAMGMEERQAPAEYASYPRALAAFRVMQKEGRLTCAESHLRLREPDLRHFRSPLRLTALLGTC